MSSGRMRAAPPPPKKAPPPPRPPPPKVAAAPQEEMSLIDWSSPPRSPTARSCSDVVSVDSFGSSSDATTPSNLHHSQPESGFEDDFDAFEAELDPFSPPPKTTHHFKVAPATMVVLPSDFLDPLCNGKSLDRGPSSAGPTIIRAKPPRPAKPPKPPNLKSMPQDIFSRSMDIFESPDRSPPMPTVPPPPPPILDGDDNPDLNEEPYAIALYDFYGTHDDDLPFKIDDKIRLIRKMNDEWYYGKLRSGIEGIFPSNYVEIKVPLRDGTKPKAIERREPAGAMVLYDFEPQEAGDLRLTAGRRVRVMSKLNDQWYYGEMDGSQGQFPANYIDRSGTS